MSRRCQVTGAQPGSGHAVSHSHRRTERRLDLDVRSERDRVPSLRHRTTLAVSARGFTTSDRRGVDAVVAAVVARGGRV